MTTFIMRNYIIGTIISTVYFIALIITLPYYGINEDSPFHFLRGQAYLQKILTGDPKFPQPDKQSPVYFIPGQRISTYKPNGSEELLSFAPLRPIGLFQTDETIQQEHKRLLSRTGSRESFYKHNAWSTNYWDIPINQTHPAVSDIMMALFNRIFYEGFGMVGDVEGYHLYIIFVSSLSIFFVYLFAKKAFGELAGIFATLTFALYPLFFAESHFNVKDPVQMSFFTISLVSFYFWVTNLGKAKIPFSNYLGSPDGSRGGPTGVRNMVSSFPINKWYLIFILSTFFALGTKWNIFFIPLILLPWLLFIKKNVKLFWLKLITFSLFAVLVAFALLIAAWPFLWQDTLTRLLNTFSFYGTIAFKDVRTQILSPFSLPFGFDYGAILRIFAMTPPIVLLFFTLGFLSLIFDKIKTHAREGLLVVLWLIIPILRVSRQETETLGSIRNYIEFLPAFAIICGVGAAFVLRKITEFIIKKAKIPVSNDLGSPDWKSGGAHWSEKHWYRAFLLITIFLYFSILLNPIIKHHPNQNLYFNFLVGGLKGAKNLKLYEWQTSYDNIYRQGINWLNVHAEKKAQLAHLDGTMLAISPIWLRDDIRYGSFFFGFEKKGEYVISIIYPDPPPVFAYNYLERFLNPIYALKVDGVDVLKIWKNDKKYLDNEYSNEKKLTSRFQIKQYFLDQRKVWDLNLGKKERVTRLILKVTTNNCTEQKGIWSVIVDGKEKFLSLDNRALDKDSCTPLECVGLSQIDFPAEPAEVIRFWDVEAKSCLYDAEIKELKVID